MSEETKKDILDEEVVEDSALDSQATSKTDKDLAEEYLAGWKRAIADYDNLKKESNTRSKEWIDMGVMKVLASVIPIYNNFKSAVEHIPQDQLNIPWVTGVMYIKQNLEGMFNELGLEIIKTVGEKFDENLHEALREDKSETEAGIILKEVSVGFKKDGKVLVPAKVVVSSGEI